MTMKRTFSQASASVEERARWHMRHVDPKATYEEAVQLVLKEDHELAEQYTGAEGEK